ncbi:hypothetical protein BG015_009567 [Linnemannia schmuckeri]|uniref:Uncharacterized protein n=1 Tax=Linnemannia schmuckeri TaxID=64567 RepID=A0A9P5RVQ9_9FUNG|nr:hypothetical protein BG015_009567 [Linnemannia schmuckeri]
MPPKATNAQSTSIVTATPNPQKRKAPFHDRSKKAKIIDLYESCKVQGADITEEFIALKFLWSVNSVRTILITYKRQQAQSPYYPTGAIVTSTKLSSQACVIWTEMKPFFHQYIRPIARI